MKEKLSVIVPIYNGEEHLEKCLNSIINQTFKDFELILIDDGSKDQSLKICLEFERKYNNVKVFHQENKGTSTARNLGVEKSSGEWITFVDDDDWIEPNTYELAFSAQKNNPDCSMIQWNQERFWSGGTYIKDQDKNTKEGKYNLLDKPNRWGFIWNKIFRANIIRDNNLYEFNDSNGDSVATEDFVFCIFYAAYDPNMYQIEDFCYHHGFYGDSLGTRNRANDQLNRSRVITSWSMLRDELIKRNKFSGKAERLINRTINNLVEEYNKGNFKK